MGLALFIGPKNTVGFFMKKSRREGSVAYFAGFLLIIIGWFMLTTIGFLAQMYGLWKIFGSFIPAVFSYLQTVPVIGPVVRNQPWLHQLVEYTQKGSKKKGP